MPKAPTAASKRACDQCNYRRIKCDKATPCDRCELSRLTCSYDKAPKPRGGKRIKELQEIEEKEDSNAPGTQHHHNEGSHVSDPQMVAQSQHTASSSVESASIAKSSTSNYTHPDNIQRSSSTPRQAAAPINSHFQIQSPHQASSAVVQQQQQQQQASPGDNPLDSVLSVGSSDGRHGRLRFPSASSLSEAPSTGTAAVSVSQDFTAPNATSFTSLHTSAESSTHQYPDVNPYNPATFSSQSYSQQHHQHQQQYPDITPEYSLAVPLPEDSFMDSLYANVQPPSQEISDFSFLQSWPYWLTGTAANSPESRGSNNKGRPQEAGQTIEPVPSYTQGQETTQAMAIDWLSDANLIPAIATFFDRLHPIMPIFTRSWILDRIDKDEHRSQSSFAGMLLALSSLVKIQPVKAVDRISRSQRNEQARALLEQSVRLRANVLLGQEQSLDEVLASFYSFATLFGMQEHDAATFRLREAVNLAQLMKLNIHESYMFLSPAEQERRLRTYWLLCITERAYALQRGDTIALRGRPVSDMAFVVSGLPSNNFSDFPRRQLSLFEHVDEAFADCWHGRCPRANCTSFTRERARLLHASFGAIFPDQFDANDSSTRKISHLQKEMIQNIDTVVTSHWLQSRLWQICLSHGLLSSTSPEILFRPAFVLQCAYQAHQFHLSADASSREAHGVGLVEKLFDIGTALLQARVLSTIDEALKINIDQLLSSYVADLNNSSEEGKAFASRLNKEWRAVSGE